MLLALTVIFILNNNIFYKSQIIFTINLIVLMFTFMYLGKYLDYDESHVLASLCQMLLFYIAHQTLKSVLQCFGVNIKEYHNMSMPEICDHNLKSYILSLQKVILEDDSDDDSK